MSLRPYLISGSLLDAVSGACQSVSAWRVVSLGRDGLQLLNKMMTARQMVEYIAFTEYNFEQTQKRALPSSSLPYLLG